MTSAGLFKLTMFIKRKPGLSEEEFHSYWTEKHPAVVNEWLAKHGVVTYVQFHTPSEIREQCKEVGTGLGSDNVVGYDGYVELTVRSIDALKNAFSDPFYKSYVQPDEATFIDPISSYRTFGYEERYIEGNKVLKQ
ncbi:uncharacterized protein TrAFT101_004855 [Trichoderma asperellum]|uniref:EthD domain-containing protein n=1 Tax=Trichoderma asperellum (strain ATCC 204424 / CBS 433.97 / NBRC 101777) TaxID=1042311 RepID=A0A2T3Z5N8_TRIA4|nr:hypothetical protein M441DRAFT_27976 [Trichoderma asperellum CBS 433.97]PTB40105.1 hypothetical protein M441DRAFT_27976 [Trichoderma asperellum CBS 433.97]UKZ89814.1 hypothetical protein TrAFT101_004855 [Trichoderma asperellum]